MDQNIVCYFINCNIIRRKYFCHISFVFSQQISIAIFIICIISLLHYNETYPNVKPCLSLGLQVLTTSTIAFNDVSYQKEKSSCTEHHGWTIVFMTLDAYFFNIILQAVLNKRSNSKWHFIIIYKTLSITSMQSLDQAQTRNYLPKESL